MEEKISSEAPKQKNPARKVFVLAISFILIVGSMFLYFFLRESDNSLSQSSVEAQQPNPGGSLICPAGTVETPASQCPVELRKTPIVPTLPGGGIQTDVIINGDEVRTGYVCCPPQLTPDVPITPPDSCPINDGPIITNVSVSCPEGCEQL